MPLGIYERDEPLPGDPLGPDDFDLSDLRCPACESNAVVIEKFPEGTRGSWWGSGVARCDFCGRRFRLTTEPRD